MGEEYSAGMINKQEEVKVNENDKGEAPPAAAAPPHFVLIHGISGGAWCWYKMRCLMENCGYRVTCLDLKGCGVDQTDPNTLLSFQDYNQPLVQFLSSLPDHHQVIVVGHSAGGLSVSDVIHRFGKKKIKLAVFVAATMLKSGYLTNLDIQHGAPDLSEFGELNEVYDIEFGLGEANPPTTTIIKKLLQRKIIYNLSPNEDVVLAEMLLRPGPIQALITAKFPLAENDEDEVPRIYIKTTQDHVIKPEQQEAMIKKWPPSHVYVLESDHSPFFSAPFSLFGLLVKAAVSVGY